MEHQSRTTTILTNANLRTIASMIKNKSTDFRKPSIYVNSIGQRNRDGEIPEKKKGSVNAYLWDKPIKRGMTSVDIFVINGYEDPLFNDEGYVKVAYEIGVNHIVKEQNTIRTHNFSQTKSAVNKILSKVKRRR